MSPPSFCQTNNNGIDIKTCEVTTNKYGTSLWAIVYLPGCEYWFPLNRSIAKDQYRILEYKNKLKVFWNDELYQKENSDFKF